MLFNHSYPLNDLMDAATGQLVPDYSVPIAGLHRASVMPEVLIVKARKATLYVPMIAVRIMLDDDTVPGESCAAGDLCADRETADRIAIAAALIAQGALSVAVITEGPEAVSRRYRQLDPADQGREILSHALAAGRNAIEADGMYRFMPFDSELEAETFDGRAVPLTFSAKALSFAPEPGGRFALVAP